MPPRSESAKRRARDKARQRKAQASRARAAQARAEGKSFADAWLNASLRRQAQSEQPGYDRSVILAVDYKLRDAMKRDGHDPARSALLWMTEYRRAWNPGPPPYDGCFDSFDDAAAFLHRCRFFNYDIADRLYLSGAWSPICGHLTLTWRVLLRDER